MAESEIVECAHCGARSPGPVSRCPQCLRAGSLVVVPSGPASGTPSSTARAAWRSKLGPALAVAVVVGGLGIAGAWRVRRTNVSPATGPAAPLPSQPARDVPAALDPSAVPASFRSLGTNDPLARARAMLDRLGARGADTEPTLALARPLETVARVFEGVAQNRLLSSLAASRALASVLNVGEAGARVCLRAHGPRPDAPCDPTGVLGCFAVRVGDHVADPWWSVLERADATPCEALDDGRVQGAMLAHAALEAAARGASAEAAQLADRAVEAWPDGAMPLAVRASIGARARGAFAGSRASRDLSAALGMRDDPAHHLLRARFAVRDGALEDARASALAARHRAPGWGLAALVVSTLGGEPDAGTRCAPLETARERWTDAYALLCNARSHTSAEILTAARDASPGASDPVRRAWVAASGDPSVLAGAQPGEAPELAAWLSVLGDDELARRVLGGGDAGR